jgi:hypothetical protein
VSSGNGRILLDQHREQLYQSGLTDQTIELAELRSVIDGEEARQILGWREGGQSPPVPSLGFVYPQTDGYCPVPRNSPSFVPA